MYSPDASLTVERSTPVATFRTVTVAPGTTEPCVSVTVPWIAPVDCAHTGVVVMMIARNAQMPAAHHHCLMMHTS
jgi:hypothetical protein